MQIRLGSLRNDRPRERMNTMSEPAKDRPIFVLRLRAEPGVDPIRSLRALLKVTLRWFGLRAIEAREENRVGATAANAHADKSSGGIS
jgi:hypothetical protein